MVNNDSDKKQSWLVPIVVTVIGAISPIAVALISQKQSSQESTPKSEAHTLQAIDSTGIKLSVSKGETLTIESSGKVHTNRDVHTNREGHVPKCDIEADPNGLGRCQYNKSNSPLGNNLPFMALIGEFNGDVREFVGSKRTMTFDTNGMLSLKVNDWGYGDNDGKFEISVTRTVARK